MVWIYLVETPEQRHDASLNLVLGQTSRRAVRPHGEDLCGSISDGSDGGDESSAGSGEKHVLGARGRAEESCAEHFGDVRDVCLRRARNGLKRWRDDAVVVADDGSMEGG